MALASVNPTALRAPMRLLNAVVVASALGTFVDVLDLTLFQSVRVASLKDLGVAGHDVFKTGLLLLNVQLAGLLIGGFLWGILADKRGRRAVLFASILTYSLATLACAWVHSVPVYALLRFIGGVGLAGEMGAGVTLIVEVMARESRGYGTTICAAAGVSGAIAGGMLATLLPWRTAYIIGGVAGLALFLLRTATTESAMFVRSRIGVNTQGGSTLPDVADGAALHPLARAGYTDLLRAPDHRAVRARDRGRTAAAARRDRGDRYGGGRARADPR